MIEGKTSFEVASKVREVPLENRKIILYTGVHQHEGTSRLAAKREKDWEEYSVLVVAHPTDNTPHRIWEEHRIKSGDIFAPLDPILEIDEDKFEEKISGGDSTIFVRFHGTHIHTNHGKDGSYRKLEILPSMDTELCLDPDLFANLGQYFDNVEHLGYPPNRICIEYWYEGDGDLSLHDKYTAEAVRNQKVRHDNGVPKIFFSDDQNWWKKSNLHPDYLVQPKLSDEDIREFHEVHAITLGDLFEHIYTSLTK